MVITAPLQRCSTERRLLVFALSSPFKHEVGALRLRIMIATNDGYLPDEVAFSARTSRADLNVPLLLQAVDLGRLNGTFGHGHAAASGGHVPPDAFAQLLAALGTPAES